MCGRVGPLSALSKSGFEKYANPDGVTGFVIPADFCDSSKGDDHDPCDFVAGKSVVRTGFEHTPTYLIKP